MIIDRKLIDYLCEISKLKLNEQETEKAIVDLNNILVLVEKLKELDIDAIEPLIYLNNEPGELREDVVHEKIPVKDILQNAPSVRDNYFSVPKFLEDKE